MIWNKRKKSIITIILLSLILVFGSFFYKEMALIESEISKLRVEKDNLKILNVLNSKINKNIIIAYYSDSQSYDVISDLQKEMKQLVLGISFSPKLATLISSKNTNVNKFKMKNSIFRNSRFFLAKKSKLEMMNHENQSSFVGKLNEHFINEVYSGRKVITLEGLGIEGTNEDNSKYKSYHRHIKLMANTQKAIDEILDRIKMDELFNNIQSQIESINVQIQQVEHRSAFLRNTFYIFNMGFLFLTLMFIRKISSFNEKLDSEVKSKTEDLTIAIEKVSRANKLKDQFLANTSHEIRTPLNGIIGYTNLLKVMKLDNESQEYIRSIEVCSDNLLLIVNHVLDFSKIEAGQLKIENRAVDISKLIHDLKTMFKAQVEERGVLFGVNIDENIPHYIESDQLRISQILINLISNAIKFTEKGSIIIDCSIEKNHNDGFIDIAFRVTDTGVGIPLEYQGKVFNSFEQGDASTTRTHGGTGLGLSICSKLAIILNGQVCLEQSHEDGSVFLFSFKTKETTNDEIIKKIPEEEVNLVNKDLRILLAEDNKTNQKVAQLTLKRLGYENLIIVNDGQEAIEAVENNEFDIVLMDVQMPKIDGLNATRVIKEKYPNLKIVGLSANVLPDDKARGVEAGMDDYIGKPLERKLLARILSES
jgi:signal transduction histidine kinase/CheY-like chemotaxis protein